MNGKKNNFFDTSVFYAETECVCLSISDRNIGTFEKGVNRFECPLLSVQVEELKPLLGKNMRCLFAVHPDLILYVAEPRYLVAINY